MVIFYK